MFPASTAKLQPGDVCFIMRSDGRFVPFAFLCSPGKTRAAFYGALGKAVVSEPKIELLPLHVPISEVALIHIKSLKENNTPLVGNIADRIGREVIAATCRQAVSQEIGAVSKVWGNQTLLRKAEAIS